MIKNSKQLKDLARNLATEKSADIQLLMRHFMMERFLERISLSPYRDDFILKGGVLITAMVGFNRRSTMDLEATMKTMRVDRECAARMIEEVSKIPLDDGVSFRLKSMRNIIDASDNAGIRCSMEGQLDGVVIPFKIDLSNGDPVMPQEISLAYPLMFEARTIELRAQNLETVLAEKFECALNRGRFNSRMWDFYDIHVLLTLFEDRIDLRTIRQAFLIACRNRGFTPSLSLAGILFQEIRTSENLQRWWQNYAEKNDYTRDLEWSEVMESFMELLALIS